MKHFKFQLFAFLVFISTPVGAGEWVCDAAAIGDGCSAHGNPCTPPGSFACMTGSCTCVGSPF